MQVDLEEERGGRGRGRRVWIAAVSAAVPLAAFYLITRPENVFYQPLSFTGFVLALTAFMVPLFLGRQEWLRSTVAMVGAAMAVTTVFVFVVGPGNLWPIAVILGTTSAAVPILAGGVLGWIGSRLFAGARAAPM